MYWLRAASFELCKALALKNAEALQPWIGRLGELGLVLAQGRTKGTTYKVNPDVLREQNFRGRTGLKGIERHRLREVIAQDLGIYGKSKRDDIHTRVGLEIPERQLRTVLLAMVEDGVLLPFGVEAGAVFEAGA